MRHHLGFKGETFVLHWILDSEKFPQLLSLLLYLIGSSQTHSLLAIVNSSLSWVCSLTFIPCVSCIFLFITLLYQMDILGSYSPKWWTMRWFLRSWTIICWWWFDIHKTFPLCIKLGHHKPALLLLWWLFLYWVQYDHSFCTLPSFFMSTC